MKKGTWLADDPHLQYTRAEFVKRFISEQTFSKEIIVVTYLNFSHFLVNRWLHGPGCGSLFNGLENAVGVPMVLRKGDSPEFGYEMRVDIPIWWRPHKRKLVSDSAIEMVDADPEHDKTGHKGMDLDRRLFRCTLL